MFTEIINCHVKEESEKLSVFQQGGVYLATKKIGKRDTSRQCSKAGMEPNSGCGIGGRCPGRRYSEGQAGRNNSQKGTIYKSTWLATRYVPTEKQCLGMDRQNE